MGVVLLVRHGQASFGADDYDVLSETGWEQSRLLGAWLAERKVVPDVVWCGDMRRHRETAEGMLTGGGWDTPVDVDAGWNEFDHLGVVASYLATRTDLPTGASAMQGVDRREFQRLFEEATARWTGGGNDGDYPESWPAFVARVRAALERACAAAGPGGTAVAISSGGPIAAACALLVDPAGPGSGGEDPATLARLWARFNTVTVNSSVTRVVVGSTGPRLLTFNEHSHLEGELVTYR